MKHAWIENLFGVRRPVIGVVHLMPLAGTPGDGRDPEAVRDAALSDAVALVTGGVHGLIIENFGDAPFYGSRVPAHTVAEMTAVALGVAEAVDVPIGINILRNDACSALAVAHASGAAFIRVNILTGARLTDQGIVEGPAAELMRLRRNLGATQVRVFADVDVKHSAPIAPRSIAEEAREAVGRGGADGLIVTGGATGSAADASALDAAWSAGAPVFIGSGVTAKNHAAYADADGLIIGSAFKIDGEATNRVDHGRVAILMDALRGEE